MGAGYCQWGGLTDRNICNIYGDAHLASGPTSLPKMEPLGPKVLMLQTCTNGQTDGKLGNI